MSVQCALNPVFIMKRLYTGLKLALAIVFLLFVIANSAKADLSSIRYEDKDIRVSLVKAYVTEKKISDIDFSTLNVELFVEPLNPTKIIKPRTSMVYTFDKTSQRAKSIPVGFEIEDNYGNEMLVTSVSPEYLGQFTKARGLRVGDKIKLALQINEVPLPSTKYISLLISKDNFKTSSDVKIQIPADQID
jgi:hypothetical protein